MQHQSTFNAQRNARVLRSAMTASERALWWRLRLEQLGVKFRRQHPLGTYIADFACLAPALIVELDGSQHAEQAAYDERRDAFFRAQGFEVLRFASNEALSNTDGVLSVILERLELLKAAAPIPAFPQRGKEKNRMQAVAVYLAPDPAGLLPPEEKNRTPASPDPDPALLLPPLGEGRDGGSL